jgi:pyruvate/2-oxoglutarate dehydrogenase complex dihydrolipoamide acyltransferase (E2) component
LRRLLIPIVYRSARLRRGVVGSFQITSLNEEMILYNRLNASTIMFLGQVRERPAVIDGKVVPRKSAYLTLGIDHRVLDGALPMKFMHEVIRLLESPRLLADG